MSFLPNSSVGLTKKPSLMSPPWQALAAGQALAPSLRPMSM
jgi:hypothetical protein